MAYAGSTIRITAAVKDFGGNVLTDSTVSAQLTIAAPGEPSYTVVLEPTAMTFDPANGWFYYDWATGAVSAGTYQIKVEITGNGFEDLQYGRVLLQAPRF